MSPPLTFTATRGLPASGKTTWALTQLNEHTWRVNRDDLRRMSQGTPRYARDAEDAITVAHDAMIISFLRLGLSVICDDTNLNPVHLARLLTLAREYGAGTIIKDFTHVSPEECITRDLCRDQPVGAAVIMASHARWLS